MNDDLMTTGQAARLLGLQIYQLDYLITTGSVPDTPRRFAGKRVWTRAQVDGIRRHLDLRSAARAGESSHKD